MQTCLTKCVCGDSGLWPRPCRASGAQQCPAAGPRAGADGGLQGRGRPRLRRPLAFFCSPAARLALPPCSPPLSRSAAVVSARPAGALSFSLSFPTLRLCSSLPTTVAGGQGRGLAGPAGAARGVGRKPSKQNSPPSPSRPPFPSITGRRSVVVRAAANESRRAVRWRAEMSGLRAAAGGGHAPPPRPRRRGQFGPRRPPPPISLSLLAALFSSHAPLPSPPPQALGSLLAGTVALVAGSANAIDLFDDRKARDVSLSKGRDGAQQKKNGHAGDERQNG